MDAESDCVYNAARIMERTVATVKNEYSERLRAVAGLMLAVAGESVSMVKRNAPDKALKLTRRTEWDVYLEFLKIFFNLADRFAALHIPVSDHAEFMDSLVDEVISQLKTALEPAFGANSDQMEIVMTIAGAVGESRRRYEHYKFMVNESSKVKDDMLKEFGERVADMIGAAGNLQVASAATLCAGAVLPAMSAIFTGEKPQESTPPSAGRAASATDVSREKSAGRPTGNEIKLVSVMASVSGEEVETRWGLHPRFKRDLNPEELQELTKLMNRVTKIVGERYAAVAFSQEWASWHVSGHA